MYVVSTLLSALFGSTPLVGWRQEADPSQDELDSALVTPTSGRYFDDEHPLLTLKNIFSIAPRFSDYVYSTWSAGVYAIGDKVLHSGINYICTIVTTTEEPVTDPTYWSVWTVGNQKSEWLSNKTKGYILKIFDDFLEQKQWGKTAKSLLEEKALFDGTQYEGETITSDDKVVGFELRPSLSMGMVAKLNRIGVQFASTGAVTINLYHSSQSAAAETKVITYTTANSMEWFDLNWDLEYLSTYDAGGSWTLEYDQSAMTVGDAINKAKDWSARPEFRTGYDYRGQNLWSNFFEVHPFSVVSGDDRKNPSNRLYEYTSNYGLNLIVSVHADYTGFFTRQKTSFQNVLAKGVALKMLREIAFNPNSRINQSESTFNKNDILYELDGNVEGRATGIISEYKQALKAVKIDTEGISKDVLPCGRRGIKYKPV